MNPNPRNQTLNVLEGILLALGGKPVNLTTGKLEGITNETLADEVYVNQAAEIVAELLLLKASTELTTRNIKAPIYTEVSITTVATNTATPTTFNAFPSKACSYMEINNHTGSNIEYRRNGAGEYITIPTGYTKMIEGITNANQIAVRRSDASATSVTVRAEVFVI